MPIAPAFWRRSALALCCSLLPANLLPAPAAHAQNDAPAARHSEGRPATQAVIDATVTVDTQAQGVAIGPYLHGVFFEDINYAADGGLYAELIQNRSFEYYAFYGAPGLLGMNDPEQLHPLYAWQPIEQQGGRVHAWVDIQSPLNANNTKYLAMNIFGDGGVGGIENSGYDGTMPVTAGEAYDFSCQARWIEGQGGPLTVTLLTADGKTLAEAQLPAPGRDWQKLSVTLKPSTDSVHSRLRVTTTGKGRLTLDMVSLFPQNTFMNRSNGLRPDLAQAIADLKPKTLRFPGGCIVHGSGLENAYRWKDTVGDVSERKPNWNRWGYHQTYGLGYFEYMQFALDIGAEPLPILPAGVSCGFEPPYDVASGDELQAYIQDALDLIEFANGPVSSKWGKVRADMGRAEPFDLKFIGVGNEDHDTTQFREVFPKFVEAIRQAHPEITIVGTSGLGPGVPLYDLMNACDIPVTDEHYYEDPQWFVDHRDRFDNWPRDQAKVYIGEYASRGNTLFNAVAEAAYLTGVDRNADVVVMTAYAPLLARYGRTQWTAADLVWFNETDVVLTPNYHVQQIFSTHAGDRSLPVNLAGDKGDQLAVSCTHDEANHRLNLKVVNPTDQAMVARIDLAGLEQTGQQGVLWRLTGDRHAINDLAQPNRIAPQTHDIRVQPNFDLSVPAMSVQVIEIPLP